MEDPSLSGYDVEKTSWITSILQIEAGGPVDVNIWATYTASHR